MKLQAKLGFKFSAASVLLFTGLAAAALNGPVGTPCGGTTTAGTTMTGTQGWSTNPATGQGYWSCCQAGTSCAGRDKPASVRAVRDLSATEGSSTEGSSTAGPSTEASSTEASSASGTAPTTPNRASKVKPAADAHR